MGVWVVGGEGEGGRKQGCIPRLPARVRIATLQIHCRAARNRFVSFVAKCCVCGEGQNKGFLVLNILNKVQT